MLYNFFAFKNVKHISLKKDKENVTFSDIL